MPATLTASSKLRDTLLACRLALWQVDGIGPQTFYELEKQFSDLRELFACTPNQLTRCGLTEKLVAGIKNLNWCQVEEDILWQQQANHVILCYDDTHYPSLLKEIAAAPPILFVQGDVNLLGTPQIAIVGSRNPSHQGKDNATQFAAELANSGYCITSGLAAGIDAASHRGALNSQSKTIAVLGTGIEHIYPRCNKELAELIIQNGALVSEFSRSMPPLPQHFPRRNRIISGLSLGVLVIEAAVRSGSLITAGFAVQQNREVFAIPGSIHNPLARGCHQLIRNGAKLVETAEDVIEEIGVLTNHVSVQQNSNKLLQGLDENQLKLVKCIDREVTTTDVLLTRSGLTQQRFASLLLDLELKGVIISVPGGYIRA